MPRAHRHAAPVIVASVLLAGCGEKKHDPAPPSAPDASTPEAPEPVSSKGPLHVVLTSKAPVVLSVLEGGILVSDEARAHLGRAAPGGELSVGPMPEGLPQGAGRV